MIFFAVLAVFTSLVYAFGLQNNIHDSPRDVLFRFLPSIGTDTNHIVHGCFGQEVMVTESVMVERHVVNITVPACPNYVPRDNAVDIKESLLGRHVIQTRNAAYLERKDTATSSTSPSECLNPSICQCGSPCTTGTLLCDPLSILIVMYFYVVVVTCGPGTSPPDPDPSIGDCRNLASVLRLFQQSIGTFCLMVLAILPQNDQAPQELPLFKLGISRIQLS